MNDAKRPGGRAEGLHEIKQAFIAAHKRGEPLAEWLERYPLYARPLIDLATALETGERQTAPSPEEIASASEALRDEVTGAPLSRPAPGFMVRARALGMRLPALAQ